MGEWGEEQEGTVRVKWGEGQEGTVRVNWGKRRWGASKVRARQVERRKESMGQGREDVVR